MVLRFFLCILTAYCVLGATYRPESVSKITGSHKDLYKVDSGRQFNITALSEGGPITSIQTTPPVLWAKENHINQINQEIIDEKSIEPKSSRVAPRKGVSVTDYLKGTQDDKTKPLLEKSIEHKSSAVSREGAPTNHLKDTQDEKPKLLLDKPVETVYKSNNDTVNSSTLTQNKNTTLLLKTTRQDTTVLLPKPENDTLVKPIAPATNDTKMVHKPLVLRLPETSNIPKDHLKAPKAQSSSETVVADQLPTPQIQMNASRQPGLIMPIVITILVVPMFAILGFMAMKRGKEAWKNRHYKRMDFLLDGMYND